MDTKGMWARRVELLPPLLSWGRGEKRVQSKMKGRKRVKIEKNTIQS